MGYIAAIFHRRTSTREWNRLPLTVLSVERTVHSPQAVFRALARCRPPRLRAVAPASPSHGPHRPAIFITLRTPPPWIFGHHANPAPEAEQLSLGSRA